MPSQNLGRNSTEPMLLGRGFTGHEHLPWCGLVNMNARLYDPALGRFLSPDPEVQQPEGTQGFNRYTYCLNNPLRYVDLDGRYFRGDNLKKYREYRQTIQKRLDMYRGFYFNSNDESAKSKYLDKISELTKSLSDLENMHDSNIEFLFNIEGEGYTFPQTIATGTNAITMYCQDSWGNIVHEMRHGGQIARGEYGFIQNGVEYSPDNRYGLSHEIDAYRAQYAVEFIFKLNTVLGFQVEVTNINQINLLLIMLIGDESWNSMYGIYPIEWQKR